MLSKRKAAAKKRRGLERAKPIQTITRMDFGDIQKQLKLRHGIEI